MSQDMRTLLRSAGLRWTVAVLAALWFEALVRIT